MNGKGCVGRDTGPKVYYYYHVDKIEIFELKSVCDTGCPNENSTLALLWQ